MSRCPKFTALHDAHDLAEGIAQITPGARGDRMAADDCSVEWGCA